MFGVKNWKARRAGAGITLTGVHVRKGLDDEVIKVTGIEEIRATQNGIVAIRDEQSWRLLP